MTVTMIAATAELRSGKRLAGERPDGGGRR
jgi:hypothetical protein